MPSALFDFFVVKLYGMPPIFATLLMKEEIADDIDKPIAEHTFSNSYFVSLSILIVILPSSFLLPTSLVLFIALFKLNLFIS